MKNFIFYEEEGNVSDNLVNSEVNKVNENNEANGKNGLFGNSIGKRRKRL